MMIFCGLLSFKIIMVKALFLLLTYFCYYLFQFLQAHFVCWRLSLIYVFFSTSTSYSLCSSFYLLSLPLSLSLFLPLSLPLSYTFSPPFSFPSEQAWHIVISCCTLWSVCCASLQLLCDNYGLVLKCEIFTYEINLHQPHPIT